MNMMMLPSPTTVPAATIAKPILRRNKRVVVFWDPDAHLAADLLEERNAVAAIRDHQRRPTAQKAMTTKMNVQRGGRGRVPVFWDPDAHSATPMLMSRL